MSSLEQRATVNANAPAHTVEDYCAAVRQASAEAREITGYELPDWWMRPLHRNRHDARNAKIIAAVGKGETYGAAARKLGLTACVVAGVVHRHRQRGGG